MALDFTAQWGGATWGAAQWAGEEDPPLPPLSIVPGVGLGVSFTIKVVGVTTIQLGAALHVGLANNIAAKNSFALGVQLHTASAGARIIPETMTLGLQLHVGDTARRFTFPTIALGALLHVGLGLRFPVSIALGVSSHLALSTHVAAKNAITLTTNLGAIFQGSRSTAVQQSIVIVVTNGGSGYSVYNPPTVTITGAGGSGSGATAKAILGGAGGGPGAGSVVGVSVTNSGDGTYQGPLTVTISGGSPTTPATAQGFVTSIVSSAQAQDIPLQVRAEGYGALTIETLLSNAISSGAGTTLLPPPLTQPSQDFQNVDFNSHPWNVWFQQVYNALLQPIGSSPVLQFLCPSVDETDSEWYGVGTVPVTDPCTFTATLTGQSRFGMEITVEAGGTAYATPPTVNISGSGGSGFGATAVAVLGSGAQAGTVVAINVTANGYGYMAPLSVELTGGGGTGALAVAQLGRQFGPGDFIIWNDPKIVAGAYSYEIDQITDMVKVDATHVKITLQRAANGAAAGIAQYGSILRTHTGAQFYRLINKIFQAPANSAAGPQLCKFLWDNMTVAAVTAQIPGESPVTLNLAPLPYVAGSSPPTLDPRQNPPAPGLRTMNGAAYTNLGALGSLGVGQTADTRVPVQAHESLRTAYGRVLVAPVGAVAFHGDANACIVVYVCYIAPPDSMGNRAVGLIDTVVIDQNALTSYVDTNSSSPAPNVPDGRQMPYHQYFPVTAPNSDWPPNRLPLCTGAFSGGALILPIVVDPTQTVLFAPDGEIDFIIGQVGASVHGTSLSVVVQT